MNDENAIKFILFFISLMIMSVWEVFYPRRIPHMPKPARWFANIGIAAVYSLLERLIFPVSVVGITLIAKENSWGLLNILEFPYWVSILIGVIALDLVIYLQHIIFHSVPVLWRLHMVHHSDIDFDVTTGIRFHPIEIIISTVIKMAAIILIGVTSKAVLIFIILLSTSSLFNHGNVRIRQFIDGVLRLSIVTPDMHRVHHSSVNIETNSNYGFLLPWWDYIFGTYRREPEAGHVKMEIGLSQYRDVKLLSLLKILAMPFTANLKPIMINRDEGNNKTD